jgi:large subunit ribosomal protein L23
VSVIRVRTLRFLGKKRRRGRIVGSRPDWKKAYVTLKEGDKIEFFEGL